MRLNTGILYLSINFPYESALPLSVSLMSKKSSLLSLVLLPFSVFFQFLIILKKLIKKKEKFKKLIICVGNVYLGGTGKTPMIEYLVRILVNEYKIAVLSRGYGRKSNGFVMSGDSVSSEIIGDQP